jgi:hypothetical protein
MNYKQDITASHRLFLKPAEVIYKGAKTFYENQIRQTHLQREKIDKKYKDFLKEYARDKDRYKRAIKEKDAIKKKETIKSILGEPPSFEKFCTENKLSYPEFSDSDKDYFVTSIYKHCGIAVKDHLVKDLLLGHSLGYWNKGLISKLSVPDKTAKNNRKSGLLVVKITTQVHQEEGVLSVFPEEKEAVSKLAEKLAAGNPWSDYIFAVVSYLFNNHSILDDMLKLDETEYSKRRDEMRNLMDSWTHSTLCYKCRYSVDVVCFLRDLEECDEFGYEQNVCCLYCGPALAGNGAKRNVPYPLCKREEMEMLWSLVKEARQKDLIHKAGEDELKHTCEGEDELKPAGVGEDEVKSAGAGEDAFKQYCLGLLDDIKEEEFFKKEIGSDLPPRPSQREVKDEINANYKGNIKWIKQYKLQNLQQNRKKQGKKGKSKKKGKSNQTASRNDKQGPISKTLEQLYKHFTKPVLESDMVTNAIKDAVLLDIKKDIERQDGVEPTGSKMHVDPTWAGNVLLQWEDISGTDGAYWLVMHPSTFRGGKDWLEQNRYIGKELTVEEMMTVQKHFNNKGVWCFKQEHGTLVTIPVGYCHAVTNTGANMKVASDFIVQGGVSISMISYMYIWREFEVKHTDDYIGVIGIARDILSKGFEKYPPALKYQQDRRERRETENARTTKKTKL